MTSEKSYSAHARLDTHIAGGGHNDLTALTARVAALESLTGSGTMSDLGALIETGALANGWGKSSGAGYLKYQRIGRLCFIYARDLSPGTVADGTTICSAANGLASTCRPSADVALVANTNDLKTGSGTNNTGSFPVSISKETCSLHFLTDGSITVTGVTLQATFLDCYGAFHLDV